MYGPRDVFRFGNNYGYNYIEADDSNRWAWDK